MKVQRPLILSSSPLGRQSSAQASVQRAYWARMLHTPPPTQKIPRPIVGGAASTCKDDDTPAQYRRPGKHLTP